MASDPIEEKPGRNSFSGWTPNRLRAGPMPRVLVEVAQFDPEMMLERQRPCHGFWRRIEDIEPKPDVWFHCSKNTFPDSEIIAISKF